MPRYKVRVTAIQETIIETHIEVIASTQVEAEILAEAQALNHEGPWAWCAAMPSITDPIADSRSTQELVPAVRGEFEGVILDHITMSGQCRAD
jgi:hypothetical protein